jgi:hypothetical protein
MVERTTEQRLESLLSNLEAAHQNTPPTAPHLMLLLQVKELAEIVEQLRQGGESITLNCDLEIDEARETFAATPDGQSAADLLESAIEYWRCDQIDDVTLAKDLRSVLPYLERTLPTASLMPIYGSKPLD